MKDSATHRCCAEAVRVQRNGRSGDGERHCAARVSVARAQVRVPARRQSARRRRIAVVRHRAAWQGLCAARASAEGARAARSRRSCARRQRSRDVIDRARL